MRKSYLVIILLFIAIGAKAQSIAGKPQTPTLQDPWTAKDLIQPSALAAILNNPKAKQPVVLNIGVVDNIKGAKTIGAASKQENLNNLKENLKALSKNNSVIIYCGCCPFNKCPNIRPAFSLLREMGFSKGKLLNIPVNLKQDWISKGYPMASSNTQK